VALAVIGADAPMARKPAPKTSADEILDDVAEIRAADNLLVEGVGLVVGLDNTGSDPEPSPYRAKLLDEMRKAGVERANDWLTSRTTSLVLVRASIPAGVDPTDRFDVEVVLTPASTTTSLAGGYLLLTDLSESMVGGGEVREGQVLAVAHGPVMTGTSARPDDPRAGRVLEGGRVKKSLPFLIQIHEDRKSYHAAKLVETVINRRFHARQGVDQKGMAEAKTDARLLLKVPNVYHQNQKRFFQVIKLLPLSQAPEQVESRLERWSKELLDPTTAGVTALRLEGLGPNAIPTLKTGLDSSDPKVRFFAAEALAYLNDSSGAEVLAEVALRESDFRIFALTALAAMDQPAGVLRLRKLMEHPELSVRYGAFSALRTLDETERYRIRLVDDPISQDDEEADAMALRLGTSLPRRRDAPLDDPFALYVVESDGPPSIHVSKARRCEIVLFGRGLDLLTPVVLGGANSIQINASNGDTKVEISRIEPNRNDRPDRKVITSPGLASVVRELVRLGATYPEVVALIESAHAQKNLPGPLVVDALPLPTARYEESQLAGVETTVKADDAVERASGAASEGTPLKRWWQRKPTPPTATPSSSSSSSSSSNPTRSRWSLRDWLNRRKPDR
jgi:flagellar basal body P-ring protein FlgI